MGKAIQIAYANEPVSRLTPRPSYEGPFVVVHQSTDPRAIFFFTAARGYAPPEGQALSFGGFMLLRHNGLFVAIQASSEELTFSAARALRPLSDGSGAGE
jgi:hypothetical protein